MDNIFRLLVVIGLSLLIAMMNTAISAEKGGNKRNRAPVVTNPGDQSRNNGDQVFLQIEAVDHDGDSLSFSATGLPSGLSIDPATGVVEGNLTDTDIGAYTVTISVGDGTAVSRASFNWTNYDLPTVTALEYIPIDQEQGLVKLAWRYASQAAHVVIGGNQYSAPVFFRVRPGIIHSEASIYPPDVLLSDAVGPGIWQSNAINTNSFEGSVYWVKACATETACSQPVGLNLSTATPGADLKPIVNLNSTWVNEAARTFTLNWNADADYFASSTGKPDYFEIRPALTQTSRKGSIIVNAGNPASLNWTSAVIDDDDYVGSSYMVRACKHGGECGYSLSLTLPSAPLYSSLPMPSWEHGNLTAGSDNQFTLDWQDIDIPAVDYVEITEEGPTGTLIFYTEAQEMLMERVIAGDYTYSLRACERDRSNGDVCGSESSSISVSVTSNIVLEPVTNLSWYWVNQSEGEYELVWNYDPVAYGDSNRRPDYFHLFWGGTAFGCPALRDQLISADNADGDFTWVSETVDEDCLSHSGTWIIEACSNTGICGPRAWIDPRATSPQPPPNMPDQPTRAPGGPDDMKPGHWWDPDRAGTGFDFYWASELRYPSMHESYGDTYDLIAFWYIYADMGNGAWQPVWLYSQLKDSGNGHFQGALYYPQADQHHEEVGTLEVHFTPGNNRAATVAIIINRGDRLSHISQLSLDLSYIADDSSLFGGIPSPENDVDHYSGLWWHYDRPTGAPAILDTDFAVMSWIHSWYESNVVVMYDSAGEPIWARADIDRRNDPDSLNDGPIDFTVQAISKGFNPLTGPFDYDGDPTTPPFKLIANAGSGRRLYEDHAVSGDGYEGFRKAGIYLDIDFSMAGRSTSLHKGSLANPYELEKAANFHDIRALDVNGQTVTECGVSANTTCDLSLNWFTDADYPDASVYVRNLATGNVSLVTTSAAASGEPTVEAYPFSLTALGQYQFELWKKNSVTPDLPKGNAKIAESSVITVTPASGASPELPPDPAAMPDGFLDPDINSTKVGATSGAFRVDESGNATYSIPLLTAPGSGGMAPQISLEYSSQAGNGVMGMGWSLGGLSSISRCAQTLVHDGPDAVRGVSLSTNDRFCLDGQRLLLVNSRPYGTNEAEYRTERDDISKIISYGSAGNGPAFFKVWRKDGSVTEYGNSSNSRIEANTTDDTETALMWTINRISDSASNYIDFEYSYFSGNPGESIEFVLSSVKYTGNITAGTSPYAELNFIYDSNRSDATRSSVAGATVAQTRLLRRIDSLASKDTGLPLESLRSYHLDYEPAGDGYGRKILLSISECNNSVRSHCYSPAVFGWHKSKHQVDTIGAAEEYYHALNNGNNFKGLALADINGDAHPDLLVTEENNGNYSFRVSLSLPTGGWGSASTQRYNIPKIDDENRPVQLLTIDLNADGYQDVIYPTNSSWLAYISNGTTLNGPQSVFPDGPTCCGSTEPGVATVMDFDGDGLADLLTSRPIPDDPFDSYELVLLRNRYSPANPTVVGFEYAHGDANVVTVNVPDLFPIGFENWERNLGAAILYENINTNLKNALPFDYNGDGGVDMLTTMQHSYHQCNPNCNGPSGGFSVVGKAGANDGTVKVFASNPDSGRSSFALAEFYVVMVSSRDTQGAYHFNMETVVGIGSECDPRLLICNPAVPPRPVVQRAIPADVNADGLADFVYWNDHDNWEARLNIGGSFNPIPISIMTQRDTEIAKLSRIGDLNGDGFPEFHYPTTASGDAHWKIHENRHGRSFGFGVTSSIRYGNNDQGDISLLADLTGDGMADNLFININNDGNVHSDTPQLRRGVNVMAGGNHAATVIDLFSTGVPTGNDGYNETLVTYLPLTDNDVYTRMNDASQADWASGHAVYDIIAPTYVVSQVISSAPTRFNPDHKSQVQYHYVGAKLQGGGRGFLGFGELITYDPQSGTRTNTRYRQDFPFTGLPADTALALPTSSNELKPISDPSAVQPEDWPVVDSTTAPDSSIDGTLLSYSINEWGAVETVANKGSWFTYITESLERAYTLDGAFDRKIWTSNNYIGVHGNLSSAVIRTFDSDYSGTAFATQSTHNSYADNIPRWHLGRLRDTAVTHERDGLTPITRSSEFSYDSSTGILVREIAEPDINEFKVTTSYGLDNFGNRISTTLTGYNMADRSTSMVYDNLGRFVLETRNDIGQVTQKVIDWNAFGNALEVENIDGVLTVTAADPMGRSFTSYTENGTWSKTRFYSGHGSYCPSNITSFHTYTSGSGTPGQYQCFDILGRGIRDLTQGFNPQNWTHVDTFYDQFGRVQWSSEPYYSGTIYWNKTEYDALGRITFVDAADGNDITNQWDYAAPSVGDGPVMSEPRMLTVINGLGQTRREKRNVLGEVTYVTDNSGPQIQYAYDAVGNLTQLIGVDGAIITTEFDLAGRKIQISDPDAGVREYAYNPLGELVRQRDGLNQAIDFAYDSLGRVTDRWERTGVNKLDDPIHTTLNHETTTWNNSISPGSNGKGQILVSAYIDWASSGIIQQKSYSYDGFGRIIEVATLNDGMQFTESTTYDQHSRVFQQFDVTGDYRGVRYHYTDQGYLLKLQEAREGENGVIYQQIEAMDQRGNVTYATLANGVEAFASYEAWSGRLYKLSAYDSIGANLQTIDYYWDVLGNLLNRSDTSGSGYFQEQFLYDGLNRLSRVYSTDFTTLNAPSAIPGVPSTLSLSLTYDASGNITYKSDVGSYYYDQTNGAGPHAVTSAGGVTYSYDGNGNQTSSSDGRNIQYTIFNKPTQISKGGELTTFTYGIGNSRSKRVDSNQVDGNKTSWYFAGVERIHKIGDDPYFKRYIGGVAIADYYPSTEAQNLQYLVKDHLGSIHVITDISGRSQTAQTLSFDAFGQRRAANTNDLLPLGALMLVNDQTTRGFTGHEHADGLGIIHMNGRIYDPKLGRFLQADPYIQAPENSQNLNRYSYVLNNPLSYTDPSGYFLKRLVKKWGRAIVASVAAYFTFGAAYAYFSTVLANAAASGFITGLTTLKTLAGAAAGAVAGFVSGAIASGSIRGAVKGAYLGAITGGAARGSNLYGKSFSDVIARTAAQIAGASNEILSYLYGAVGALRNGVSTIRNVAKASLNYGFSRVAEKFANKKGLSLAEFNTLLFINSYIGRAVAGTSVRTEDDGSGACPSGVCVFGFFSRDKLRIIGALWDINDTVLGYQGLPDAVSFDYISRFGGRPIYASHSLGALRSSNLVALGFAPSANLFSLPFGNIAASNTTVTLGKLDLINGGVLGAIFNPGANLTRCEDFLWGGCHAFDSNYRQYAPRN